MTETSGAPVRSRGRLQLPSLAGGLVIAGLIVGAVAPLWAPTTDGTSGGVASGVTGGEGGTLTSPEAGVTGPGSGSGAGDVTAGPGETTDGVAAPVLPGAEGSTPATTGGGSVSAGAAQERTASDIGVTKDVIRIGVMNMNCEACAALGITSRSSLKSKDFAQAYTDDINSRGGINGRKLELHVATFDPAQDAANGGGTERAACIELTENKKVFVVPVTGVSQNTCLWKEHKTPVIMYADPGAEDPDTFNAAEGRIWTIGASARRTLVDWGVQLAAQKLLTPSTKFSIVYDEGGRGPVEKYLVPELAKRGLKPTRTSNLGGDLNAMQVKIAQEVPASKAEGITHVVFASNFAFGKMWIQEAERNGWKPQYLLGDYTTTQTDYQGDQWASAGDFTGAIALSSAVDRPVSETREVPAAKSCIATFERVAKRKLGDNDVGNAVNLCTNWLILERALAGAGANPTRASFVQAMARLGRFEAPTWIGGVGTFGIPYAFGNVRWSGIDLQQRKVWRKPCPYQDDSGQCFVPEGPVYRMAA